MPRFSGRWFVILSWFVASTIRSQGGARDFPAQMRSRTGRGVLVQPARADPVVNPGVVRSARHAQCGAVPDAGRRGWERGQCADTGRTGCGLDAPVRRTIVGGVAAERAGRMVRRGRDDHFPRKGAGDLRTITTYQNFELKADFWADDTMNSAIFVRCPSELKTDLSSKTCYEVNIYDPHASWPTGSVNEVQTTLPERIQTAGKWNWYEIMLEGSRIAVKLNGKTTVDARNDLFTSGTIALQANGPGSGAGRSGFGISRFVRCDRYDDWTRRAPLLPAPSTRSPRPRCGFDVVLNWAGDHAAGSPGTESVFSADGRWTMAYVCR